MVGIHFDQPHRRDIVQAKKMEYGVVRMWFTNWGSQELKYVRHMVRALRVIPARSSNHHAISNNRSEQQPLS